MAIIPNSSIAIKVIFEDDSIIIIDKPAGIPVYPVKKNEKETLANGLVARWKELADMELSFLSPLFSKEWSWEIIIPPHPPLEKGGMGGFVHRLDNDTSGLLLAAKTKEAYENLRRQFDKRTVLKQYTALVLGETDIEGVIETPIIHDPHSKKKMKACSTFHVPRSKGQKAWTGYKLIKKYMAGRYSLLEVTIKTGVRHQIRVHLASIGHPIAGDKLYQNQRQRPRDETGLKRQFLHASKIGFNHPKNGNWVEFECELVKELRNVLTKL